MPRMVTIWSELAILTTNDRPYTHYIVSCAVLNTREVLSLPLPLNALKWASEPYLKGYINGNLS